MTRVHSGIILGHANTLKNTPALYPLTKSTIKTYSLSKGLFDFGIDDLFLGDIPNQIILGLVSRDMPELIKETPLRFKDTIVISWLFQWMVRPSHPALCNPITKQTITLRHSRHFTILKASTYNAASILTGIVCTSSTSTVISPLSKRENHG